MANTTFSGPVKAGTISNTTGTTVGTNIANVGFVSMAQSVKADIIGASHLNQVCAVIPANSQITDVIVNVTTVNNDTGAATILVGITAGADTSIATLNVKALATTHGTLDTEEFNVGRTDLQVLADFTGSYGYCNTGAATVTVM